MDKMASAASESVSKNDPRCVICAKRCTQQETLGCIHSFCQKCLRRYYRLMKDTQNTPCPVCRKETQLSEGVPGLGDSCSTKGLLEDASSLQTRGNMSYCDLSVQPIRQQCPVVSHRKPIQYYCKTAALEHEQLIKNAMHGYKREIKAHQSSLAVSSKAKQKFGEKVARAKTEVHAKAAQIIAQAKEDEDRLTTEIITLELDRYTIFDEHDKNVRVLLQEKQHSLDEAENAVKNSPYTTYLKLYGDMTLQSGKNVSQIDCSLACLSFTPNKTYCDVRLGELDVEGKWVCQDFGGSLWARGIAALPGDEIAVADFILKVVLIFNTDGQQMRTFPLGSDPCDIAAINNQLVVVGFTNLVKIYNEDGTLTFDFHTVPGTDVEETTVVLRSVAVMKDGTIIVGDVERKVITQHRPTDGSLLRTIPVRTSPYFLTIDSSDRVVVSGYDQHTVDILDGNGAAQLTIKPTINGQQVKYCTGVCCNSSNIYIAVVNASDTGHIHSYDAEGRFLSCIAQDLCGPKQILFTADGQKLVVAVADDNSVRIYQKV